MAEKKPAKNKGLNSTKGFFKDVRFELTKVIWPGKNEVVASTVVVLMAVLFFAVFVGLIDVAFVNIVRLIST